MNRRNHPEGGRLVRLGRLAAASIVLLSTAFACGGGAEEAPDTGFIEEESVPFVADSVIERNVESRFAADPRLASEELELVVHSRDQEVTLVGEVPSRVEWSIVREVTLSTPGVKRVHLDSLKVLSEHEEPPGGSRVAPPRT